MDFDSDDGSSGEFEATIIVTRRRGNPAPSEPPSGSVWTSDAQNSTQIRRSARLNPAANVNGRSSDDEANTISAQMLMENWGRDESGPNSDSEFEIEIEGRDITALISMERAYFSNLDAPDNIHEAQDVNAADGEGGTDGAGDASTEDANQIRFDTNLPVEHSYLGDNMNRVSGVEYLEAGKVHRIMLFMHQHIVFPGEVLPFMIPGFIIDADIDSNNGLLFGVAFGHVKCPKTQAMYGVTCQIYEKGTDERGNTLIKSRAMQRFVTTNDTRREHLEYITSGPQLKTFGHVRILPEISLPDPLASINMGSMNRFRDINGIASYLTDFRATTTAWPKHVYNQFTITGMLAKVLKSLEANKVQSMPTDPTRLSFWLGRNAHISEDQLSKIFMTDCVNIRMRMIADAFSDGSVFVCRVCRNPIAHCRDLFAMSKHGVQSQYCNPSGYIHETNTVYKVFPNSINFSGEPSSEFSWFPGYQWQIVVCKMCNRHIGWQFRANEENLSPKLFFGITGASVKVSKNESRTLRNDFPSNLFQLIDG